MHGAPITLNLYGQAPAAEASRALQSPALPAPAIAPDRMDRLTDKQVGALREVAAPFAPEAPAHPVNRDVLTEQLHALVVFDAACVRQQTGAVVAAADVYGRYADHAGPRAVSEAAFHSLYPVATGRQQTVIGGIPHYADIVLLRVRLAVSN